MTNSFYTTKTTTINNETFNKEKIYPRKLTIMSMFQSHNYVLRRNYMSNSYLLV